MNPGNIDKYKKELAGTDADSYSKARGYKLPRGWRVSYDENRDKRYGYGMATDWLYAQYGIYSITTELWNPEADIPGLVIPDDDNRRVAIQRALLKYQDEKYDGELFINWKPFRHPELGEGETGGWKPPISRNNAFPGEPLLNVCEKHWQFELFRAGLMPDLAITDVKTSIIHTGNTSEGKVTRKDDEYTIHKGKSKGKYHIVEIRAVIENKGALSTNLAEGESLPGNRQDVAWLIADREDIEFLEGQAVTRLGSLGGTTKIPGIKNQPSKKDVRWLVAVKDNTALKVVVSSLKGGTVVKEIRIK